jgi:hypothetical protein
LQASGSAVGGQGRLDAALRRVRFLPRGAQIGLRGLGRRKRRCLATVLQISVAVATLLAMLSLGTGLAETGRAHFADDHFDVWIQAVASKPLGSDAGRLIASTEGVREVQPWVQNNVRLEGRDAQAWGLPADALINPASTAGAGTPPPTSAHTPRSSSSGPRSPRPPANTSATSSGCTPAAVP